VRLTVHTDFALRVLIQVGLNDGKLTTINEIAQRFFFETGVSETDVKRTKAPSSVSVQKEKFGVVEHAVVCLNEFALPVVAQA